MSIMQRHDLVWLDPDIDAGAVAADNPEAALHWIRQRHPLVFTRQPATQGADQLALGFTQPLTRTRISLRAPRAAVIHRMRPLLLPDAMDHAPDSWRENMFSLQQLCENAGTVARVYGSLSSHAFTGENCLDEESDLDLLLECSRQTKFDLLLAGLEAIRCPKIDGEILMPTGWAVAWRELFQQKEKSAQVLAKSNREVRLLPVHQFLGCPDAD
jgi:phosphoribosyl-dephospho-CoA transferase